jgi:AraC family transcriptional regulator, regulatory protein of adaptative response / methylated-DNA-[protein]-cysteine methyltransferase
LSIEHAKNILNEGQTTLFDDTYDTGFYSTSRGHDSFVKIERMLPDEFKNGGKNLIINYSHFESPFGKALIASTQKGICTIFFYKNEQQAIIYLQKQFPNALFTLKKDEIQENNIRFFDFDWKNLLPIKLHLKGTEFQLKVWEALLKIPVGKLESYGKIAKQIGNLNASRAVGTAIGSNPVAFLIPCHRVIQANGTLGGYRWGEMRKSAIFGWEASQIASLPIKQ